MLVFDWSCDADFRVPILANPLISLYECLTIRSEPAARISGPPSGLEPNNWYEGYSLQLVLGMLECRPFRLT
jgi:hypothetical protein